MKTKMEIFNLYMVVPKGYPEKVSVVVAQTQQEAIDKCSSHPSLSELVALGAQLICMDINTSLASQGYTISVSRLGMYH